MYLIIENFSCHELVRILVLLCLLQHLWKLVVEDVNLLKHLQVNKACMKALLVTLNLFRFCRWSSSARRNFLELKCCKSLEWIFRSSGKNLHSHVSNCILTPNVKENLCKSFNVSVLSVYINRGENLTLCLSLC